MFPCGVRTYCLFKGLTAPGKWFNELVSLMANHENPKRNTKAERFKLNMGNHRNGESSSQCMEELRTPN